MPDTRTIEELEREIVALARAIYERGREDKRLEIAQVVGMPHGGGKLANGVRGKKNDAKEARNGRAPKGLAESLAEQVLRESPEGVPMAELQARAVAANPLVNPKTIYNVVTLNKDNKFRNEGDNWFLLPKREAETAEAPVSSVPPQPWTVQPEGGGA